METKFTRREFAGIWLIFLPTMLMLFPVVGVLMLILSIPVGIIMLAH